MSYRKGLQCLTIAVLLVGTAVLGAGAQESLSNPALQQWVALQEQFDARYQAGDYAGAERLTRQALAVAERAFGSEHPATATSLNNLAVVLKDQSRYGEAELLFRRTLAMREKVLEAEHPDIAISFNNLAAVLQDQGRYGEAESLYRRALVIQEKVLGAQHHYTATTLDNLVV